MRKFKKLINFFTYFAIALIFLLLFEKTFSVNQIEITGVKKLAGLQEFYGNLIFLIDEASVEDRLIRLNPNLKSVVVKKSYPDKLKIEVSTAPELATLEVGNGFYYLSPEARILKKTRVKEKKIAEIKYYQKFNFDDYSVGDKIENNDISFALDFIDKFVILGLHPQTVDISSADMLILKSDNKLYYLTTQRTVGSQFEDLKTIVQRFKIEGVNYKSIDLRFEKPIIKL